jgi:hypothetical protein
MRGLGKSTLTLGLSLLLANVALAQVAGGVRPGGGGGGGVVGLLQRPEVRKELKLSDEQFKKVPDAVLKALAEVLDADQLKRLNQIELQQRGAAAFSDPKVQTALKMTDDQKEAVATMLKDSQKEMADLFREMKGNFQGMGEKMATMRKELMDKVSGVLKADQKRIWRDMIGEEFKMGTFRPGATKDGGEVRQLSATRRDRD